MTTDAEIKTRIRQLAIVDGALHRSLVDAQVLADAGDFAGATALIDVAELAAYPALALGGGGSASPALLTVGNTVVLADGVATSVDFSGSTPIRDTLDVMSGVSGYHVPLPSGVWELRGTVTFAGAGDNTHPVFYDVTVAHDADEPNLVTSVRLDSNGIGASLSIGGVIPLEDEQRFFLTAYYTDGLAGTAQADCVIQATRLGPWSA